jgi:L-arabinose isomerase
MVRPRIGLLFLSSAWLTDVGLQPDGSPLLARQRATAERLRAGLAPFADLTAPGLCATAAEAGRAATEIAGAACDLVVVAPLVWCEDQLMRAALGPLRGEAIVLCTLMPAGRLSERITFTDMLAGSGVVGTLQASGMLARESLPTVAVSGGAEDPGLHRSLMVHARARAALRATRGARIGVLPFRCDSMSVTWVDELALRTVTGIEMVPLECADIARRAARVPASRAEALAAEIRRLPAEVRVPVADLEKAARIAAAIEDTAGDRRLDGLACNDIAPELHAALGMRPCLPSPALCARGFVVSMEADVAACAAMLLLRALTDAAPFYTEILNAAPADNLFLMGHAGWHDPACRDAARPTSVIPDEEYRHGGGSGGAALVFAYPPGPMTAVNLVQGPAGLRATVFEGESLPGPARLEEDCSLVCRPDGPLPVLLDRWIQRGVSQHWVVVPGRAAAEIDCLWRWAGVPCER